MRDKKKIENRLLYSLVKKHLNEHIMYYIFYFLLKKVLETYPVYTVLFIALEFIFILKQIFCLPKKASITIFEGF